MRERNVPHRHLCLMAKSITELEMYVFWPGLSTAGDRAICEREGYLDAAGVVTAKGKAYLAGLAEKEKGAKNA